MDSERIKQMEKPINILAWIYIITSGLLLCGTFFMFGFMMLGGLFSEEVDAFIAMTVMAFFVAGMMLVFTLPGFIAGYGLLKRKSWSRPLTIVLGLLQLMSFPIGTVIGVYTFYVMFQNDANEFFPRVQLASA